MAFPNLTEYKSAVSNARMRLASVKADAIPDAAGTPLFLAGNFAGVFKMAGDDGAVLALKCFTRQIPQLSRRYQAIAAFTKQCSSPFFLPFQFLPDEIYVTSRLVPSGEFPVLVMPWLEARSLGTVIRLLCERQRPKALAQLTQAWARLCLDLLDHGVAHGDLKHDNLLITEQGKLRLIDYDSMYLPALKGLGATSLGSAHFQHPGRTERHFGPDLDHVSMMAILLALRHLLFHPGDFHKYDMGENILFTQADWAAPHQSALLQSMKASPDLFISDWAARLELACQGPSLAVPGLSSALKAALRLDVEIEHSGLKWLFYRRV